MSLKQQLVFVVADAVHLVDSLLSISSLVHCCVVVAVPRNVNHGDCLISFVRLRLYQKTLAITTAK